MFLVIVQKQHHYVTGKGKKVKEADLYSAFIEVPYTQGAQVRITQCYLQTTPYLPHAGHAGVWAVSSKTSDRLQKRPDDHML